MNSNWSVLRGTDGGNDGGRYSGTVVMSLGGGTKGVCKHVNTPTLKWVLELRKSV